jgi:di/tricarboxylate transporter
VLIDAVIAPAFPSNTSRGGVLFPVVLSVVDVVAIAALNIVRPVEST